MNKSSGNIMLLVTAGILMAYTAFRSVHLVQGTLPPGSEIMGYAALFGLDFSLIAWTVFKMFGARGEKQHAIATYMVCIQIAGVGATLLADTWFVADAQNAPAVIGMIALWIVPIIITINIAAVTATHLSDPSAEIRNAKNQLEDEINKQIAEQLRNNRGQIAGSITPEAARLYADEMLTQFMMTSRNGHGHNGKNGHGQQPLQSMNLEGQPVVMVGPVTHQVTDQAQYNEPEPKSHQPKN